MSALPSSQNLTLGPLDRAREALRAARLAPDQLALVQRAMQHSYLTGLATGLETAETAERGAPSDNLNTDGGMSYGS